MKKGLGRGLESLFGVYKNGSDVEKDLNSVEIDKNENKVVKNDFDENIEKRSSLNKVDNEKEKVVELPLGEIDPNKDQPRKKFTEEALKELAYSIQTHGVIQPIVVTPRNGRYMIIAGERRWRASKLAGVKTIPAIVRDYDHIQTAEISIIENLQREDLNPMEEARALKKLMDDFSWTQEYIADRLGKSRPVISNTIRLLNLEPEVIEMIEAGKISAGHARSLVIVSNRDAQIKLAKQVSEKKLTVRDLEKIVKEKKKPQNPQSNQSIELKQLVSDMQRVFSTKVSALGSDNRGRIYIDYYNRDDLERIYEMIEFLKRRSTK